jgi:hypothetical protein
MIYALLLARLSVKLKAALMRAVNAAGTHTIVRTLNVPRERDRKAA